MRFASVGPDGFARLWGVPEAGGGGLRLLALQQLALPCAAVAVDPAGEVVVCGAAHAPRVYVLRATDLTLRSKRSLAAQAEAEAEAAERGEAGRTAGRVRGGATALRFSPSGACLAVGAGDGCAPSTDALQGNVPSSRHLKTSVHSDTFSRYPYNNPQYPVVYEHFRTPLDRRMICSYTCGGMPGIKTAAYVRSA